MLVKCKACGKEIGKGVKKCVHCGADQRNWFSKHKVLTGILAFLVIGIIGYVINPPSNSPKTVTPVGAVAPASPKAAPMVVTADKLVEDLKGNALNASETYKGKYIELTGELSNIDSGGKYFSIAPMNDDFSFTSVKCDITKEHIDTVSKFTEKQKVTVTGTMTDVGEIMGYTLKVESIK